MNLTEESSNLEKRSRLVQSGICPSDRCRGKKKVRVDKLISYGCYYESELEFLVVK